MKNIFKLSLISLLTAMAFTSCAVDDDPEVKAISKNIISASISPFDFQTIPEDASEYDAIINFSQALPDLARLTYTIDGEEFSVDAPAGDTSAAINLDYSTADYHEVELLSFQLINASVNNNDPQIIETEKEAKLLRENTGIVSLSWDDPFYDIDVYIFEMNSDFTDWNTIITGSEGVTNYEEFSFSNDILATDTNYSIGMNDYWRDAIGQVLMLNVIFPDGQVVDKEIIVSEGLWFEINFTKNVDDNGTPLDPNDDIITYDILN